MTAILKDSDRDNHVDISTILNWSLFNFYIVKQSQGLWFLSLCQF